MDQSAPQILLALEGSGFARAVRQSVWLYPMANVLHVVAVTTFAGAVAVMDFALLGLIGDRNLELARRARQAVVGLFVIVVATGAVLFAAEASHVALNRVFQLKLLFIALALANALLLGRAALADVAPSSTPETHAAARIAAILSIVAWIAVVALGRLIAYY